MSVSAIMFPFASSFTMPPISSASISPPNRLPFTSTPIEAMPTIGNSPASSFPMSIWMPWIEPENVEPVRCPSMPVTLADSVSRKLVGSVLMFGHWIPIESMWIGSQLGQLRSCSPSAAPTESVTPKSGPGAEGAVAEEREARRRAGDRQAGDADRRACRAEADERVARAGAGVDLEVRGRQLQERPEVDRQLVGVEDERLEAGAVELERRGDGPVVGVRPVRDRAVDRLARAGTGRRST